MPRERRVGDADLRRWQRRELRMLLQRSLPPIWTYMTDVPVACSKDRYNVLARRPGGC